MDDRYEALCEIGDLVIAGGRYDLVETYYQLLCEHYPPEIFAALATGKESSESESEEEDIVESVTHESPVWAEPEPEPEPELKECKEIVGGDAEEEKDDKLEDHADYDSDDQDSEEEGYDSDLTDESIDVARDAQGFLSLA